MPSSCYKLNINIGLIFYCGHAFCILLNFSVHLLLILKNSQTASCKINSQNKQPPIWKSHVTFWLSLSWLTIAHHVYTTYQVVVAFQNIQWN